MISDARAQAKALDAEFASTGRLRGPLHGVPVSFKDVCKWTDDDAFQMGLELTPRASLQTTSRAMTQRWVTRPGPGSPARRTRWCVAIPDSLGPLRPSASRFENAAGEDTSPGRRHDMPTMAMGIGASDSMLRDVRKGPKYWCQGAMTE